MREIHDHYFHQAKRDGYRSRAAYKLIEIDDRRTVFSEGDRVLDLGAAPGSWLQVAARRVGPRGVVVGIDLKPIEKGFRESNIVLMTGDFRDCVPGELRAPIERPVQDDEDAASARFDVIISDMAPGTTGDPRRDHYRSAQLCEAVLDRLLELLRPGGNLVMKVFEGEQYPHLLKRTSGLFESCKGFKPKASRSESVEMYIVALGYRGSEETTVEESDEERPARSRPRGWA